MFSYELSVISYELMFSYTHENLFKVPLSALPWTYVCPSLFLPSSLPVRDLLCFSTRFLSIIVLEGHYVCQLRNVSVAGEMEAFSDLE